MKFRKPDIKGLWGKIKNFDLKLFKENRRIKKEEKIKKQQERYERRLKTPFGKAMKKVRDFTDKYPIVVVIFLACLTELMIEVMSRHSFISGWEFMVNNPYVFLYNAFLVGITYSIAPFFKNRSFARAIITVVWLILGFSNGYVLLKRVTPFNAQDLKVLAEAMAVMHNYLSIPEVAAIVLSIFIVCKIAGRFKSGGAKRIKKVRPVRAILGVLICVGMYIFVKGKALDNRIVSAYFGNIAFAYEDYGFPYCFSASLFNTGISQPMDYSKKKIDEINKDNKLEQSVSTGDKKPNIIVVQLESYFDPREVEFLKIAGNPTPNLTEMSKKFSSGYFKVPSVGAGTANTEFEVLTGMNMRYFGPGEYPYKTYVKDKPCESAASALEELGYGTHALHNNGGNFYSRAKVFNNMGFDSYTSKEFMNILRFTENGWAKDDILVKHINDALDADKQQDFVFCVSVQGHGDYPAEKKLIDPPITVGGIKDEALKNKWEYYVNQVYEMDAFAGHLVKEVEKRNEPTVIVFYGDHLPTLGLNVKDLKSRYLYNTNYVIWDNIGLKKQDRNIPAYQLMADVMNRVDIHAGTLFNYHQERRKTKEYLSDLELLQYDMLYGKKYVYGEKEKKIGGYMQMGVKDVEIDKVIPHLEKGVSLYGKHFTKYSKVYINGSKKKSQFLNNTRIELPNTTLKEGDEVKIIQMGSSETPFRVSDAYCFENGKIQKKLVTEISEEKYKDWMTDSEMRMR